MLSLFIMSIMALALTAVIGYSAFSTMKSTETFSLVHTNVANMERLAGLIKNELRLVDGDQDEDVPMGETADGRTVIPSWIAANASTPWGVKYSYCPYSTKSGTGVAVVEGNGATYEVTVQTDSGTGKNFVVASQTTNSEVAALIVSPLPNSRDVPNCSDVTPQGNGRFIVNGAIGGTVMAVLREHASVSVRYERRQPNTCDSSVPGFNGVCKATCPVRDTAPGSEPKKVIFGECFYQLTGGSSPPVLDSFWSDPVEGSFLCKWRLDAGNTATFSTGITCADVR